jgi:hypothetical protein
LNAFGFTGVSISAPVGAPYGFIDATGDNEVAPEDAVALISHLNWFGAGEGEAGQESGVRSQGTEEATGDGDELDALMLLLSMDATDVAKKAR